MRSYPPPRPSNPPSPHSSSSPVIVVFLSSPGRDSLEFVIDGSPDGKKTTGRVPCRSSSRRLLRVLLLLRLRLRLRCRRRLRQRPPPRRGRHRLPIPPNASPPSPPSPPSSSLHRHRRHFRHHHHHRPGPSALRAHIYPCTKNNSCIACHFIGCRRAGQRGGGGGGGGYGGIQRSVPCPIVSIVPIAR